MARAPDVVYRGPFRASPCKGIVYQTSLWATFFTHSGNSNVCTFSNNSQHHPGLFSAQFQDWYNDYYDDDYAADEYGGFVQYAMMEDFYESDSTQSNTASLTYAPYAVGLPTQGTYASTCFDYDSGTNNCQYPNSYSSWAWSGKFKRDAVELRALSGSLYQDITGNITQEPPAWLVPWPEGYSSEYYYEWTTYQQRDSSWDPMPFLFTIVSGSSVGSDVHQGGYDNSPLPDFSTTFTDSQGTLTMGAVSSINGNLPGSIRTIAKYTDWKPHGGYSTCYVHLDGTSTQILYNNTDKKHYSSGNNITLEHDGYTWVLTDSTNSRTLSAYLDGLRTSVQVSPISYSLDWKDSGGTTYTNYLVASSSTIITNGKGSSNPPGGSSGGGGSGGNNQQDGGNDSGNNTRTHDAAAGVNASSNTNVQLTSFSIGPNEITTYTLFSQGFDNRRTYHVHAYQSASYLTLSGTPPLGDPDGPDASQFGEHAFAVNVSAVVTDNDTNKDVTVAATGHGDSFNGIGHNDSFTWAGPLGANDSLKLVFRYYTANNYPGNKTINLAWW